MPEKNKPEPMPANFNDPDIFSELETSFPDRCRSKNLSVDAWRNFLRIFPADLSCDKQRPSLTLARTTGDMGLGLIWIVQAALIRPVLDAVHALDPGHEAVSAGHNTSIGALAVSENREAPLIVENDHKTLCLNGTKTYITGGSLADTIFLGGRFPGEAKISTLIFLPVAAIPEDGFKAIDVGCLHTACHAALVLKNFQADTSFLLPIPPGKVRKLLASWGIVERSCITEALFGLSLYLAEKIREYTRVNIPGKTDLESGLSRITRLTDDQIRSARTNHFVQPLQAPVSHLAPFIENLKHAVQDDAARLPNEFHLKFKDLLFFSTRFMRP